MTDPLADKQAVREVILRYTRGIDRRDYDLVRSCYHDDGYDDHGSYQGGVDGFIEHLTRNKGTFERTMHFIGNQLIEVDGDVAYAESCCISYHRMRVPAGEPIRDVTLWLRYVDRLERRGGEWRIAHRVCAHEWSRVDEVTEQWQYAPATTFGRPFPEDVSYRRDGTARS